MTETLYDVYVDAELLDELHAVEGFRALGEFAEAAQAAGVEICSGCFAVRGVHFGLGVEANAIFLLQPQHIHRMRLPFAWRCNMMTKLDLGAATNGYH